MAISIRGWVLAMIATGLFFNPVPTSADVGPLQMFRGGGVVAPQPPHQSIRLDSQEVILRLKPGSYVVDVGFNLFNTGETTTESIGFPKWVASRVPSYPTFMRFEGSVNGEKIAFNEKWDLSGGVVDSLKLSDDEFLHLAGNSMKEQRQWLVSKATFAGHSRTSIHVTYEAPYCGKGYREASYIYGTGALWKDNIAKAVFIVDSTEIGGTEEISTYFEKGFGPKSTTEIVKFQARPIGKNIVRYEIKDFKPHPEAYLRIRRNETVADVYNKADYAR